MIKLYKTLFSRYFISAALILLELTLLFYLVFFTYSFSFLAVAVIAVINVITVISLVNRDANPEYKVSWLVIVLLIPPFGTLLYHLLYSKGGAVGDAKKFKDIQKNIPYFGTGIAGRGVGEYFLDLKEKNALAAGRAAAILNDDAMAEVYRNTSSKFFSDGEEMFLNMLSDIVEAEKYIFLEYFIISEGYMWGKIYELLCEKVKRGVEVRIIYDDIGCMKTLPLNFDKRLSSAGIKCLRFSPVTPRISTAHNNRDHRKILIVDGKHAYTGGINIADEYINKKARFGHWKDGGIRISGEAVRGFVKLFLSSWHLASAEAGEPQKYLDAVMGAKESDGGFYIPFGSGPAPIYKRPVCKNALLNTVNQAEKYVYITTPYLVIDYGLTEALRNACARGVDVRIITPGIADKRLVKIMTKSSYPHLIEAGVKIYEYAPGFIHEKSVVCDDFYALVGTVNLDYRSFAHHYEDAVWIYASPTVIDIKREFLKTLDLSLEKRKDSTRLGAFEWCMRNLMRLFAPLF